MNASAAGENFRRLRESLPEHVTLVVAAKGRSVNEVAAVIEAGARVIGENYVPEVERHRDGLGALADRAEWHMIGHVQRNKTRRALARCDVIQSVDSARLARALNERAEGPVRVCVEVCIAGEQSKQGVAPEGLDDLLVEMSRMANLSVEGLMTMEPYYADPELARPHFGRMRVLFDRAAGLGLPNVCMRVLSMGMTNSYRVAVEEGANMVRVGTAVFGPRPA